MFVSFLQRFGWLPGSGVGTPLKSLAERYGMSIERPKVALGQPVSLPGAAATGVHPQAQAQRRQAVKSPAKKNKTPVKAVTKAVPAGKTAKAPAKVAANSVLKPTAKGLAKTSTKAVLKPKPVAKPAAKPPAKTTAKPAAKPAGKVPAKSAVKPQLKPPHKAPLKAAAKTGVKPSVQKSLKPEKPVKPLKPVVKSEPKVVPHSAAAKPLSKPAATARPVTPSAPAAKAAPVVSKAVPLSTRPVTASQPLQTATGAPSAVKPIAPAPRPAAPTVSQTMLTPPPLKPGRRSSARTAAATPPPAPMVPTHSPDAAKASYSTVADRAISPAPHVAARKDPKLANNWKTKEANELTDEEVKAMPDSEYMNEKQLAFFRHKLSLLKHEIHTSAGETTEHLREDTVVVPDPADRATIEEEHALELRTRDRERKLLKKIEQSITRIDAGDYGYCDETGESIGVGRLIARPTASLSLEAQQRRELKQKMFGD